MFWKKFIKKKMDTLWYFTVAGIKYVPTDELAEWAVDVFAHLEHGYNQPHRHYHNFGHIRNLLKRFKVCKRYIEDPLAVELAIWFHDIVFDPLSSYNEDASADLAYKLIMKINRPELADKVRELIMFTKWSADWFNASTVRELRSEFKYASMDFFYLRDMDWSGFGLHYNKFAHNSVLLRAEVPFLTDKQYDIGRLGFLEVLTELPRPLYCSQLHYDRCEQLAQENIEIEIRNIKCILEN